MIHYISNGVPCMCCGKIEYPYIPYICDAHTYGLTKYFSHQELQIVLDHCCREPGPVSAQAGPEVREIRIG